MERELDTLLDYAIFQTSSVQNRYDAIACCKGEREKLVSGPLDPLALLLTDAKMIKSNSTDGTFKLQSNDVTASPWFNKSTLLRFLHAVNSPEMLKSIGGILNEMSQLEETRKFHLSLYSKDQNRLGGISGGFLDNVGMVQQVNAGTVTSEATKNELIRALVLRLTALNEEVAVVFSGAIGSNISPEELSYLSSFVHHFCTPDLRDSISKNLKTILNHHPSEQNSSNQSECAIRRINTTGVSPAKIAQVERESSTESEEEKSTSGAEESETMAERSRPVIRAPSPRRSASPMRRVQIGRSGSRRAQAIAIKSLSYFSGRDRSTYDQGPDDSGEEGDNRSAKKTEVNVTRISVKDAISLFECKQKDEGGDGNKKKTFGFVGANKAVLRRWSSGVGESCTSQNSSTDLVSDKNDSTNLLPERGDEKVEEVVKAEIENRPDKLALEEGEMEDPVSVTTEEMKSQHEEFSDKALASAEWNRQKEAELNEMLLKMMGSKPGKYGLVSSKPNDQKGDHYSQYKEKRDAKLKGQNTVKRVTKQVQETVNKPVSISKKAGVVKEKKNSPIPQQRQPRRSSSPLVAPKKEALKATTPASSRKASPRASPLPSTRSSWSTGPVTTKSNSSQKSKSSTALNSSTNSNTPISRRKPQPQVTPPAQPNLKTSKPFKTSKESTTGPKLPVKGQEEKKPKTVVKTSRVAKPKNSSSLVDESCPLAKPSLYNKVTKKSSVVPLESKLSLKKSPVPAKAKVSATVPSPKDSVKSLRQSQEKDMPSPVAPTGVPEVNLAPPKNDHDTEVKVSPNDEPNVKEMENVAEVHLEATESSFPDSSHGIITPTEVQTEDDLGISSAAWVEEANQLEAEVISEIGEQSPEACPTDTVMEPALSSSPKIRHSLSQMLQADTHEPEIIEWGNAENPPALVFQKDSPKGFKRLLKFARKSNNNSTSSNKGEANSNGWASPSVLSEGEDDVEEYKGAAGNAGPVQIRGHGPQRGFLSESFDGGFTNKRGIGSGKTNTISSAQSNGINLNSLSSDKLREGNTSSTKASRSFFSLSNFRSNKSNETKPR